MSGWDKWCLWCWCLWVLKRLPSWLLANFGVSTWRHTHEHSPPFDVLLESRPSQALQKNSILVSMTESRTYFNQFSTGSAGIAGFVKVASNVLSAAHGDCGVRRLPVRATTYNAFKGRNRPGFDHRYLKFYFLQYSCPVVGSVIFCILSSISLKD